MDRREFLQKSLLLGGGLALESMLLSCATIGIGHKEDSPVIYPRLRGHKIQPPENGCLIGFFNHYRHTNPRYPLGFAQDAGRPIDWLSDKLGQKPAVLIVYPNVSIFSAFPMYDAVEAASRGVIPYFFTDVSPALGHTEAMAGDKQKSGMRRLEDIAKGLYDQGAREFANGAVEFGKIYGGFFINTMYEMNIDIKYSPWTWSDQPSGFKKAWRHLWQVFEDEGANEYATWVIEYHIDFRLSGYYPGDQYIDWIGFSAFNRAIHHKYYGYRYLKDLIDQPYYYFRTKHPNKPIMISEFGTTNGVDQPEWLTKAYNTIKSRPGIKAANYWNHYDYTTNDDPGLREESLLTLRDVFKTPYYIMAR